MADLNKKSKRTKRTLWFSDFSETLESVNLAIHFQWLLAPALRVRGSAGADPTCHGAEAGETLVKSPVHGRAT